MVLLIRAVRNTLLYIFVFSFVSFLFAVVVLFFSHIGVPDVNQAIGCLRWGERRHELLLRFSRAVSSSQSHCRTRRQRYIQKMRPAKRGLILGNIRKNFRKEWRILVYFPRKDSERIHPFRALRKSSPLKIYLGVANGLISSALRSSVTLLSTK